MKTNSNANAPTNNPTNHSNANAAADIVPISTLAAMAARGDARLLIMVSDMLHELGVPSNLNGYYYLRDAIILAVYDTTAIHAITKLIYPTVAKNYATKASCVERSMRNAIENAWNRGDIDIQRRFFGCTVSCMRGKPTNSEFIALIADRISLQINAEIQEQKQN